MGAFNGRTQLEPTDWKMKVLRKFKSPLQRQIAETLRIEKRGLTADQLLNQKGEWNGVRLPRIRLESVHEKEEESEENADEVNREDRENMKSRRKCWRKSDMIKRKNKIEESNTAEDNNEEIVTKKKRRIEESDNTSCLRGKEFNEIVLGSNSREVPEQELQDKRESPGIVEEFEIREVKTSITCYFVETFRENHEEEDWQEEEDIIKVRKIEK